MTFNTKWLLPAVLVVIASITGIFYLKSTITHAEAIPADSIKNQLEVMYNGKIDKLKLADDVYEAELIRAKSVYALQVEGNSGKVLSMELVSASPDFAAKQEKEEKAGTQHDAKRPEGTGGQQDPVKDGSGTERKTPSAGTPEQPPAAERKPAKPDSGGGGQTSGKPPAATQKPAETPAKPKPQPKPQQPTQQAKPPVQKPVPQKTVLLSEQQAVQIALRQLNGEVDDVDFVKTTDGGYYLVEIDIDVDDGPDEATYQIHAISGKIMSVTWDD